MVTVDRRALALITTIALAATLSACSSTDEGVSLTDTKGPTQLLRNDAASRVPHEALLTVGEKGDAPVACALEDDPDKLFQKWQSSIVLEINSSFAPTVGQMSADLSAAYAEDGWDEFLSEGSGSSTRTLKKDGSRSELIIQTTEDADGDGLGATIEIDVNGQCVKTGGPDSDEVKRLS